MDYIHQQGKPVYVASGLARITKKVWGERAPFPIERKETGRGADRTTEMSDYFDYAQYDRATRAHAFYPEMLAGMIEAVQEKAAAFPGRTRILELGCGNGSYTDELIRLSKVKVLATDIDENAIAFLKSRLKEGRQGTRARRTYLAISRKDALTYRTRLPFDIVTASWNYEHITNYENGPELARAVAANLKDDGVYVEGAELVGTFGNEQERQQAFIDYHEDIIDRALASGHQDTAEIEWGAMVSGIMGVSHFKRDAFTHIREMGEGGLEVVYGKKYGPFTPRVGDAGVYLFVFRKRPA